MKKLHAIEEIQEILNALAEKIRKYSAEFDAQAIGNALYGLQKMKSNIAVVSDILGLLLSKLPDNPSWETVNLLAWQQAIAACLSMAKITGAAFDLKKIQPLWPEIFSTTEVSTYDDIMQRYVKKLKSTHWDNDKLDLHGLDHLSASLLLNEEFRPEELNDCRIIFGRGNHSKAAYKRTMETIVQDYFQQHKMNGRWALGSVTCSVPPSALNLVPSSSGVDGASATPSRVAAPPTPATPTTRTFIPGFFPSKPFTFDPKVKAFTPSKPASHPNPSLKFSRQ